jgi:putative membrane protein
MALFLLRLLISALSLGVASYVVPGMEIDGIATMLIAAFLLGIVNAVVRPVLFILTLPITIVTLGLFLLVINAGMLGLVAWLLPGFTIEGFWAALGGWLIVSIVGWLGSRVFVPPPPPDQPPRVE